MVYNPDSEGANKERLRAFLVANLDSQQLDAIQQAFGRGVCTHSATPQHELFIEDKREWHGLTHAEMRRTLADDKFFIVIDEQTPEDGGVWYIENFAQEDEVADGEAENTNVVWKIRMQVEDLMIKHVNYDIGNENIREDLDSVDVDYPTPEDYIQPRLYRTGFDYSPGSSDKFTAPTWVTARPDELEETSDREIINPILPEFQKLYRLKPEIARQHGLKNRWTVGGRARNHMLPDGTMKTFPEGSLTLQMDYDPEIATGAYQRPEGSL